MLLMRTATLQRIRRRPLEVPGGAFRALSALVIKICDLVGSVRTLRTAQSRSRCLQRGGATSPPPCAPKRSVFSRSPARSSPSAGTVNAVRRCGGTATVTVSWRQRFLQLATTTLQSQQGGAERCAVGLPRRTRPRITRRCNYQRYPQVSRRGRRTRAQAETQCRLQTVGAFL